MAIDMTLEDKIFQWASGEVLTECMPEEVVIGDDEAMLSFIEDHVIEAYEYSNPQDILETITATAWDAQHFFTKIKDEL